MLLFVNACFRKESRTERLARTWLAKRAYPREVEEIRLCELDVDPLDAGGRNPIAEYCRAVDAASFEHPMFDIPKQFAQVDEVLIAAPVWNYGLPAKLHAYLELACSQGITFDLGEGGVYRSLCKARRLTFVTTAGGLEPQPEDDHAFGYIRTLARRFWHMPQVDLVAGWGLDVYGADVEAILADALDHMRPCVPRQPGPSISGTL